jgi:hypothetical protein
MAMLIAEPTFNEPGFERVVLAKDQPEYNPLPIMRNAEGVVISEWMPTAEELAGLVAGRPLRLMMLTFNHPFQPVLLTVPTE